MLTIGQVASYAGVTVRAVRHYHAKGLLPEPERNVSGYRHYDAHAVIDLIKIRTLADAGVPLARIQELLVADVDEFDAAVAEIDRRLLAEIIDRQRHRERITRLTAGNRLDLPPEAVAYLDRLHGLGIPMTLVEGERDSWLLVNALMPDEMTWLMNLKQHQLDEPSTVRFYRDLAAAMEWGEDDPRVLDFADQLAAVFDAAEARGEMGGEDLMPEDLADLLDTIFVDSVPIARRLLDRLEERGWQGWTRMERTHPHRL